jgi:hypothetical protein
MANSVHYAVVDGGLELYSTHIGARVHQEGLTIRPKNAKWLTIPLRARGGEAFAKDINLATKGNRSGMRARDYKHTFFREKFGKLYLLQKQPGRKDVRALFVLVKKATMAKNEWFGFTAPDVEMAIDTYGRHIDTFVVETFDNGGAK